MNIQVDREIEINKKQIKINKEIKQRGSRSNQPNTPSKKQIIEKNRN